MTTPKQSALRIIVLLVGGVVLNIILLAFAGAILQSKFELRRHFLEAQQSPAASKALTDAFRAQNLWWDFVAVPIVGCLIGAYAGLFQKRKPALLAVGCLVPMLTYELVTQPLRTWPVALDLRYFGTRAAGFVLAILVAASLRGLRDRRTSAGVPAQSL